MLSDNTSIGLTAEVESFAKPGTTATIGVISSSVLERTLHMESSQTASMEY